MKKEVLIAIVIGFGLGLVIAFGIWSANKALKQPVSETAPEQQVLPSPTPTLSIELFLIVNSPEDNTISEKETIIVSGQTITDTIVVLLYNQGEKILETDENGEFNTEIPLAGGVNEIKVAAYDQDGNQVEKILSVVYSTAQI